MANAIDEYAKLIALFAQTNGVETGQMFGKPCIKVHGKAFLSQHKECVIFKLTGTVHGTALALTGAHLWDPSGKGRPMKEWVAVPGSHTHYAILAKAAHDYVAAV